MDESEIECRIRQLESEEIPHVRMHYNKVLYEFLDSGCFPSPALHSELDAAKEDFLAKQSELEELKRLLFYLEESD
ncbi:MAG: hypothetical protein IJ828_06555 [Treponema sp.]|nr:hypothetical protein [Treponema sp.]